MYKVYLRSNDWVICDVEINLVYSMAKHLDHHKTLHLVKVAAGTGMEIGKRREALTGIYGTILKDMTRNWNLAERKTSQ